MSNHRLPRKELIDRYTDPYYHKIDPAIRRLAVDCIADDRRTSDICKLTGLSANAVKSIARTEATPIAQRRAQIANKSFRVATRALDRIDDSMDEYPIHLLPMIAGIATDKFLATTQDQNTNTNTPDAQIGRNLYNDFIAAQTAILQAAAKIVSSEPKPVHDVTSVPVPVQPALSLPPAEPEA